MKLSRLIRERGVDIEVKLEGTPPEGWPAGTNPWKVTLLYHGRALTVPYYTGPAIEQEPDVDGVLDCLLWDASRGEQSFEEFCAELGFDPDSRKAYAVWEVCRDSAPRLRELLGEDFDEFQDAER